MIPGEILSLLKNLNTTKKVRPICDGIFLDGRWDLHNFITTDVVYSRQSTQARFFAHRCLSMGVRVVAGRFLGFLCAPNAFLTESMRST